MQCRRLVKLTRVTELMALGPTSVYDQVKRKLLTPPIKLTARSSAWPEDEIAAINAARIAGKSDEEIRTLVRELVAARRRTSDPGPACTAAA